MSVTVQEVMEEVQRRTGKRVKVIGGYAQDHTLIFDVDGQKWGVARAELENIKLPVEDFVAVKFKAVIADAKMTREEELAADREDALDEMVQDVYDLWRQVSGDHKMQNKRWEWHDEDWPSLVGYLEMLGARVRGRMKGAKRGTAASSKNA